jgi:hypothetical protein
MKEKTHSRVIIFYKPEASLLNKSLCSTQTFGVTKFKIVIDMILVTLSQTWMLNKPTSTELPEAGLLNKSSCLARTLGVTKFINMRDIILVALCCAT